MKIKKGEQIMSNEEKARELAIEYCKDIDDKGREVYNVFCEGACLEMAKWKEERMMEKACEWLEPIFKDLAGYNCGGDLINAFKKAMEE